MYIRFALKNTKMILSNYMLWMAILFNVLTNIGFNYASKVDTKLPKYWMLFIGSLVFGFLNSYCFTESLRSIPLNVACAIFFSVTIVGMCAVSYFLFHETMNWKQTLGIFVIVAGVILVNAGDKHA